MRTVALLPTHQRVTSRQGPGLTHFPDNCTSSETSCSLLSQGGHCRGTPTTGTMHNGSLVPPRLGLRGLSAGPADRCHFSAARKAKPGPLSAHRSAPNSEPTALQEESCACLLFQEKKYPHVSIVLDTSRPLGWVVKLGRILLVPMARDSGPGPQWRGQGEIRPAVLPSRRPPAVVGHLLTQLRGARWRRLLLTSGPTRRLQTPPPGHGLPAPRLRPARMLPPASV